MANPPLPRDVQDFQFKLVSRLKIFERGEDAFSGPVNLLAVSSKHGLVFIASPNHLQIFETSVLLGSRGSKGVGADVDTFPRHFISLPSHPSHVGISCDQVHVAVALPPKDSSQYPTALIYSVTSLISKNPTPSWELRLSSVPGVAIQDLAWNPRLPQLICFCLSDGSVCVNDLKGPAQGVESISLPSVTGAKCNSWSPKGKQLAIGTVYGPFIQYKPDLKQVKVIAPPQPAGFFPISLLWLSSFQFAVVYSSPLDSSGGASRPGLYIVNAPKGEIKSHLNYDDICYSSGELRPLQYYLAHIPKWNVLLMSSANSMEVGVLAADGNGGEPLVWEQWTLEDASRAELPLSPSREEMYAVGMAIDTSPSAPLPWGENQSIPPAPLLLVLSHHGLLCSFNIINLRPGAAQDLCSPPEVIPGFQQVLVDLGPPSSSATTSGPSSVPHSFGTHPPVPQSEGMAFPPTSNAFLQSPSSLSVSAPPNYAAPTSSTAPSLFGVQSTKTDAGRGWLSGRQGTNSFGFGALGHPATVLSNVTTSSGTSFSFNLSTAAASYPVATTTVTSHPSQPPNTPAFSFTPQASAPAFQAVASTQPALTTGQGFQSFGIPPSVIAAKPASVEKSKPVASDLVSVGKLKFGSPVATPESIGSSIAAEITKEDHHQSLGSSKAVTEVPRTVPEVQITCQTPISASHQSPESPLVAAVPDVAIFGAISQETTLFEKELKQLKIRSQKFNIVIGTPEEKTNLRVKVDAMESFLGELSETTHSQTLEIAALRTLLVEAFAWVEEARSRHLYSKNPRYLHLAMVQGLDPVIKKHVIRIRNQIHYLDTQLQQMDSNLDNQWSSFQDSCTKKKRKQQNWGQTDSSKLDKKEIHIPSLDCVYQTILSQQQILEKHKARLEELELKVKNRANWELSGNSYASLAGYQNRNKRDATAERASIVEQDLSSMAESLLALQLGESKFDGGISEKYGSKNPLIPKKMSPRHMSQLCSLLAHKPMTRVIPSPRGISSLNILPIPSKITDSKLTSKKEASMLPKVDSPVASPSGKPPRATSTPVKKEIATSKTADLPMSCPKAQTAGAAFKGPSLSSSAPAFGVGVHTVSQPQLASGSTTEVVKSQSVLSVSDLTVGQSKPLAAYQEPAESSSSPTGGLLSPISTTNVTALTVSTKDTVTFPGKGIPVATTSFLSSYSTTATTKGVTPHTQSTSVFSEVGSSAVSTSSSGAASWTFSNAGSFNIGSSSKPGGISSGKPVVSTASPSFLVSSTTSPMSSTTSAFSMNFSKPSFSLTPKPAAQLSFTLPSSAFGSQSSGTSTSSKEPLFVFGGSSLGSSVSTPPFKSDVEESAVSSKKESVEKEKETKQAEEKVTGSVDLIPESKEQAKQTVTEKGPSTFSFGFSFGQPTAAFGRTVTADSASVSTAVTSAVSPVVVQTAAYEDITPENKVESSSSKGNSEEKSSSARNLFSDFSFKLPEAGSETFTSKPLIFGGSGSPSATPSTASTSIFGSPTSTAPTLQPTATTAPDTAAVSSVPVSEPVISQAEPPAATTTTTANPLSSLGNIVANLGSNTFGKPAAEVPKPQSSTFSSFSFALPAKDDATKPPSQEDAATPLADTQKTTPVKGFPSVSSPGATSPGSVPLAVSSSSAPSDFGQGLANMLGQSMPSSSSPAQQQSVQNPFATGSSLFSSGTGSSPSTAMLFGKPAEGTPAVGLFGQPLKQDDSATSFFGSSSATTPTSTSVPTFGSGPLFGQPTSSSASVFGGSGFGSKPVFGQSMSGTGFSLGGSVFGQSGGASTSSSSIFGSPSASTSSGNMFQTPATSSTSVFGSSGGPVFGSVAQAGFGSPTSSFQAKPGGFGGSPVFGAMASGGSSPSFGGAATFGSPPAFGSHVFGSSVPSGGAGGMFGSGATSSPSTFENLASAQTLTFENLAQSGNSGGPFGGVGASQPQAPPAFGNAGSSGGASGSSSFGGSSFTIWR